MLDFMLFEVHLVMKRVPYVVLIALYDSFLWKYLDFSELLIDLIPWFY